MSDNDEPVFTTKNKDGEVNIEEDGHITRDNINDMIFTFDQPQDITENLNKKNTENTQNISRTKNGNSGYAGINVIYPDGSSSKKICFEDCILQYSEAVTKPNSKYAKDYMYIGFPEEYLNKIFSDALQNSQMNLDVKPKTNNLNGHYWVNCNLSKLEAKNAYFMIKNENAQVQKMTYNPHALFNDLKKNIRANLVVTFSASMTTKDIDTRLDFLNGKFFATIKPTEIVFIEDSDVEAPTLPELNARKNETVSWTEDSFASGMLAELAKKKLRLSGRK
jgi:hypothetical protein